MEPSAVILGLIGILQIIFMFVLKRLFDTQDKLYNILNENQKTCRDKIEKEADEGRKDRETIKYDYTNLLDKHYVTTGQLRALEEKLIGQIKALSTSIEHLTSAIHGSFKT